MFFGQFVNPGNNRWQHLTSLLGHRKAFEPFDHGFGGLELITIAQTADEIAAITEPEIELVFEASGVRLKK